MNATSVGPDSGAPPAGPTSSTASLDQQLRAERERNTQLQQALTSRIVVEQAKGILHERFHITIDQAFHLLRTTARNNRQPLRELAQQIIDHSETPSTIIQTLARQPLDSHLHERAQTAQARAAHRKAKGLRDDAQALHAQAEVQIARANRNRRKEQT